MAAGGKLNTDILAFRTFDIVCSMCENQGKNTDGEKFCVECNDYFCLKCVKIHSKVPLLVGHKVLDKTQVTPGIRAGVRSAQGERCDRHSHKHIDRYCQNHDNVGCSTCMALDHRSCKDTFYIPEYIKHYTEHVTPRRIQAYLSGIGKTLAEQVNQRKQDKQRLQKRKTEVLADIRKFRQELDRLEKNAVDKVEDLFKLLEDKIETEARQLKDNMARVTSANDKLAYSNKSQSEVFVYLKMGEHAANLANMCVADSKIKGVVDVEFKPDMELLQRLEQSNILGELTEKNTKAENMLFEIQAKRSYCVKLKTDKDNCDFTSSCCMEGGTIILADTQNQNIKRLDSNTYTVTGYCDLPAAPGEVCAITNSQVAISLSPLQTRQKIHFISLEGKMKITNKITIECTCIGLAYANNNLYISDSRSSVYIYTLLGRKLKEFNISQEGQKLFSGIHSLTVSKDATRIYVADYHNGLIVLDKTGQIVTTFKDKQIRGANCCCLTEAGSVLVSGLRSTNVVQFTSDGDLIGQVIKNEKDKNRIQLVCYNLHTFKMCIIRSNDNNIEVYGKRI